MITERKIYMSAARPALLEKGLRLQANQKVKQLKFNSTDHSITALVEDDQVYQTKVVLNQQNNIVSHHCSCENTKYLTGACEHVVATLKQAQLIMEESKQQSLRLEKTINDVFDAFSSYDETSLIKSELKVEIYITCHKELYRPTYSLYLKAGLDKLYVIRHLREFLEAFQYNYEIEYGKSFTLNPEYHQLPHSLKSFFKVLEDIQIEGNDHYKTSKDLVVDEHYFRKIINSLKHQKFFMIIDSQTLEVYMSDEAYEPPLRILDHKNSIRIDLASFKQAIPLTSDYHYILSNHYIYHLDTNTRHRYVPFLKAIQQEVNFLEFKGKNKDEFITKIIPNLPKNIEIPESLKNEYIMLPLEASLYLDKINFQITATPKFKYGQYEFNPIKQYDHIHLNQQILVRQNKKEEELMNLLDNAHFKVQPDCFYLDDEKDVLAFISQYLPILQANMEIYYSDSFKTIVKKRSIFSSIRFNEQTNLFEFNFNYDDLNFKELKEILKSYKLKQKYYRLIDGSFISLDDKKTLELIDTLDYLNIDVDSLKSPELTLTLGQALFLNQNMDIDDQNDLYFKKIIDEIIHKEKLTYTSYSNMKIPLRDYQIVGLNWLKTLSHYHLGGILADDMGLGKTLQTIAFLSESCKHSTLPNLVICPTSLVYNWEDEIKKFNPDLKYLIISGSVNERKNLIENISSYQVVITSYPLVKKDIQLYQNIEFNHCFLDEAQYIKNADSLNAKSVKLIKAHTRFALTGTPIENSLSELWSIFDFIMPGLLLTHYKFKEMYELPIIKDQDKKTHKKLMKRIQPFILRRMKNDVLKELPDKIETKYLIDLSPKQKELYLALLQETQQNIANEVNKNGYEKSQIQILAALTRLRQLCNHPSLFLDNYYGTSGKIEALNEIIDDAIESNHKILIFSQFTSMLHLIEEQLKLKEISYGYLDGITPMETRQKVVREFNEGESLIFLVSLKAGGTGLNLTGANMVIHVDPWWNPAVEQQATDRAYRIGQTRNVQVIKLIAKGTIEEKIYELQQRKLELIDSIIKPGETFISKLSKEEMLSLFE
ncbi:MAG: SNF2-related protein [Beduini sp.]